MTAEFALTDFFKELKWQLDAEKYYSEIKKLNRDQVFELFAAVTIDLSKTDGMDKKIRKRLEGQKRMLKNLYIDKCEESAELPQFYQKTVDIIQGLANKRKLGEKQEFLNRAHNQLPEPQMEIACRLFNLTKPIDK